MLTQLEVLRLIAPEFSTVSDTDVQNFLDIAPLYINPEIYPVESRGLALVLMACSLMVQRGKSSNGESSGDVIEEKEGDLSRKYGQSTGKGGEIVDIYRRQLDQLSLGVAGVGIMTRVGNVTPYV